MMSLSDIPRETSLLVFSFLPDYEIFELDKYIHGLIDHMACIYEDRKPLTVVRAMRRNDVTEVYKYLSTYTYPRDTIEWIFIWAVKNDHWSLMISLLDPFVAYQCPFMGTFYGVYTKMLVQAVTDSGLQDLEIHDRRECTLRGGMSPYCKFKNRIRPNTVTTGIPVLRSEINSEQIQILSRIMDVSQVVEKNVRDIIGSSMYSSLSNESLLYYVNKSDTAAVSLALKYFVEHPTVGIICDRWNEIQVPNVERMIHTAVNNNDLSSAHRVMYISQLLENKNGDH